MVSGDVAVFPCSSSQRRLWLLEQLGRGGRSLTVLAPLILDRAVDTGLARRAPARNDSRSRTARLVCPVGITGS